MLEENTHCEYSPSTRSLSSSSRQSLLSTTTGGGLCSVLGKEGDPGPDFPVEKQSSLKHSSLIKSISDHLLYQIAATLTVLFCVNQVKS